ncbi:MAG TPA: hypothetical protein VLC98_13820 [Phnomibacter sp.]|nr:hypothetical protein [Phnomibacter sp.]
MKTNKWKFYLQLIFGLLLLAAGLFLAEQYFFEKASPEKKLSHFLRFILCFIFAAYYINQAVKQRNTKN